MPIISEPGPKNLLSGHFETIIPSLFRTVKNVSYKRVRWDTPDGDFLDADLIRNGNSKVVIISHGLEGDSYRPYVKGMAKYLSNNGFDIVAWNFRGCSGELNRKKRFYHSGATDDLEVIVNQTVLLGYDDIYLVGFSLGGNVTLKFLGEERRPGSIKKAVAFSVPLHLHSSCLGLIEGFNKVYADRFVRNLQKKLLRKAELMPGTYDLGALDRVESLIDFDEYFTAPIHGFKGAVDYYESCSALYFLESIDRPTLIVNALNDSFLSERCYPRSTAEQSKNIHLLVTDKGGHVGFGGYFFSGTYWSEIKALEFFNAE